MRRNHAAAALIAALVVLSAVPARAAQPLTYEDEAGDTLDGRDSMDIVRVTHDLQQVNKSGPPSLVVEMELAAPPEDMAVRYVVSTEIPGCGSFTATYRPSAVVYEAAGIASADFYLSCEDEFLPSQFRIDGNVLRWAMAIDGLPGKYSSGKLEGLSASTDIVDPATGEQGTGQEGVLPMDDASTDQTWSY